MVAVVTDGTAIVVGVAVLNEFKVVKKDIKSINCVINDAGYAGVDIAKHLIRLSVGNIILCDKFEIINEGIAGLNPAYEEISKII